VSYAVYLENLKRLKERLTGDNFKIMCSEGLYQTLAAGGVGSSNKEQQYRNARLTKAKFRNFLMIRYGASIADKLSLLFDFSTPIDFSSFQSQVESLLKSRELLR
jgi:hypothetical protein